MLCSPNGEEGKSGARKSIVTIWIVRRQTFPVAGLHENLPSAQWTKRHDTEMADGGTVHPGDPDRRLCGLHVTGQLRLCLPGRKMQPRSHAVHLPHHGPPPQQRFSAVSISVVLESILNEYCYVRGARLVRQPAANWLELIFSKLIGVSH
jgi:hypothetical protein